MNTVLQILMAFFSSIGFCIVFHVQKKYWAVIAVDAALSWGLYLFCVNVLQLGTFFSNIASAFFCSLYAHIVAKIVKCPTTCLLMPATVPMIPGGSLYYTMYYAFRTELAHREEMLQFKHYLTVTWETIFAMAIGFAIVTLFFRMGRKARA